MAPGTPSEQSSSIAQHSALLMCTGLAELEEHIPGVLRDLWVSLCSAEGPRLVFLLKCERGGGHCQAAAGQAFGCCANPQTHRVIWQSGVISQHSPFFPLPICCCLACLCRLALSMQQFSLLWGFLSSPCDPHGSSDFPLSAHQTKIHAASVFVY